MTGDTACRIFRFGVFEVNEGSGELHKQGVRLKLHAQPFQVLILLLERPTELVSRDEIRQKLWGEGTFVDFDHGLNTAVNKVRHALRDSASEPRYVETVPGKGYRFIAPVTVEATTPAEPAKTSRILAAPRDLPSAPRKLVLILLLLVQGMYLAFYLSALGNLPEIREILEEERLPASGLCFAALVATAVGLIPVRLFICAAVAFDVQELPAKFNKLLPVLLCLDLFWALSPFLLVHHISIGTALGMCAALVYLPFAQRSLILMYSRGRIQKEDRRV
jgi:DNA-binding winged helix-turn-helix (wHTH) protein